MLDLPQKFDFNGQSIAWGDMGDGDPLVLVHGTPFSSQVWRRIAPLLARCWKVYFFDLLGYGQSEKRDQQDVSLGVQNGLLAALIREWVAGCDRNSWPDAPEWADSDKRPISIERSLRKAK